jgi:hypothetical protein
LLYPLESFGGLGGYRIASPYQLVILIQSAANLCESKLLRRCRLPLRIFDTVV